MDFRIPEHVLEKNTRIWSYVLKHWFLKCQSINSVKHAYRNVDQEWEEHRMKSQNVYSDLAASNCIASFSTSCLTLALSKSCLLAIFSSMEFKSLSRIISDMHSTSSSISSRSDLFPTSSSGSSSICSGISFDLASLRMKSKLVHERKAWYKTNKFRWFLTQTFLLWSNTCVEHRDANWSLTQDKL